MDINMKSFWSFCMLCLCITANETTPQSLLANEVTTQDIPSNETSTQSETTLISNHFKYSNETVTNNAKDDQKFTLFAERKNESNTELHVGMKTAVRIKLICPPGFYNTVEIGLERNNLNIDIDLTTWKSGSSIRHQEYQIPFRPFYSETGFIRVSLEFLRLTMVNVSSSQKASNNQLWCDYEIFLHNSQGLQDGQNVSTIGYASISSGESVIDLEEKIQFTARSSIMQIEKSALFELDATAVSRVTAEVKTVTAILFRSWVPDYNPKMKVILNGNFQKSGFALYLRVFRVGDNFYPGAHVENLLACKLLTRLGTEEVILTFPSHWVNRGYYESENTTDGDLIEFEAGVVLSESAYIGTNYSATISILLNDTQVWSSTIILIANSSSINKNTTVKLSRISSRELLPGSQTSLILEISTQKGTSDNLDLRVSTTELTGTSQSALEIENIILDKERTTTSFTGDCSPVNFSLSFSKMKNSSIQNLADGTLSYINPTKDSSSNNITLIVYLRVDSNTAKFGDTHIVSAVVDKSVSTYNIIISKPDIFQDKNGDVLSKVNMIFDGNGTTCLRLPGRGEVPPLFWMKINTEWLNISSVEYNVIIMVAGEQISCNPNGQHILQVYFPITISKNGFQEEVKFCSLASEDFTSNENQRECVYSCKCKNSNECGELVLFMANHGNTFSWSLCELSARNV